MEGCGEVKPNRLIARRLRKAQPFKQYVGSGAKRTPAIQAEKDAFGWVISTAMREISASSKTRAAFVPMRSLQFDSEINAPAYQILRICERNFYAVAILNFNQVDCLDAATQRNPCASGLQNELSAVAAAKQALVFYYSQKPETNRALNFRALR